MHGQPEVFAGLKGATLDGRWKVSEVHHSNADRSVTVQVKDRAREFRLEVLKRDKLGVAGVGESRSLSVYVVNHGNGSVQTDESEGLAARALATWLDDYEKSGKPVPELVTLAAHAKPGGARSNEL